MLAAQKWIVCEESGRWTAALRMAFSQLPKSPIRAAPVRSANAWGTFETLGRVWMRSCARRSRTGESNGGSSTAGASGAAARPIRRSFGDVGLSGEATAAIPGEPDTQPVADLLWEVGAVEVVESPRQLGGLLALHRSPGGCSRPDHRRLRRTPIVRRLGLVDSSLARLVTHVSLGMDLR